MKRMIPFELKKNHLYILICVQKLFCWKPNQILYISNSSPGAVPASRERGIRKWLYLLPLKAFAWDDWSSPTAGKKWSWKILQKEFRAAITHGVADVRPTWNVKRGPESTIWMVDLSVLTWVLSPQFPVLSPKYLSEDSLIAFCLHQFTAFLSRISRKSHTDKLLDQVRFGGFSTTCVKSVRWSEIITSTLMW